MKYTENAAKLPLTEGLWFTALGLTDCKIYLADPQGSSAAFIGIVTAHVPPGQPAQRRSRADLIKISNLYFDAIEQSSGTVAPFDDNCNRLENGMRTAGPPLNGAAAAKGKGATQRYADGIASGTFEVITAIQPRRVLVIDEEKGLTFGVRVPYGLGPGWE